MGRNFLSAVPQPKDSLVTGRCHIKEMESDLCPFSFPILKSIGISETQERGPLLPSKTRAVQGPSDNAHYHQASIFQHL